MFIFGFTGVFRVMTSTVNLKYDFSDANYKTETEIKLK